VELSPQAASSLADFSRQAASQSQSSSRLEQGFGQTAPLLAAKFAASFHLLTPHRPQPLPGAVMEEALQTARLLSADTANLAQTLAQQQADTELERTAEKMFEFLADMGRTKPWPLWKRFDRHPKALMTSALERLIGAGRARRHPDGQVEALGV
jgi:hypothetical protein